jgi:hypothetical protein
MVLELLLEPFTTICERPYAKVIILDGVSCLTGQSVTGEGALLYDSAVFAVSQVKFIRQGHVKELDSASGFFYDQDSQVYFITNRHVVVDEDEWFYPDELRLLLNSKTGRDQFEIPLYDHDGPTWLIHPEMGKEIDVVALPVELPATSLIIPFSDKDFIDSEKYIPIGEDLLVIGYPLGIYDRVHNTPIIRRASIASPYLLPYEGKPYFLIDSCLHEGTSGSPVLFKPTVIRGLPWRVTSPSDIPTKKYLIGVHSGPLPGWREDNPTNLNVVWYAKSIPEIIRGKKKDSIK